MVESLQEVHVVAFMQDEQKVGHAVHTFARLYVPAGQVSAVAQTFVEFKTVPLGQTQAPPTIYIVEDIHAEQPEELQAVQFEGQATHVDPESIYPVGHTHWPAETTKGEAQAVHLVVLVQVLQFEMPQDTQLALF